MKALLRAYPSYRPLYLVAREHGAVRGLLPIVVQRRFGFRQLISLPHGTHGGPVVARDAGAAAALGRAFAREAGRRDVLRFEMTIPEASSALREALAPSLGHAVTEGRAHEITLHPERSPAAVTAGYARGTRRSLEAAERGGVRVTWGREAARQRLAARLHREQARAWVGIPPHPEEAVAGMIAAYGEDARVYVAEHEAGALAACVVLDDGDEAVPWLSGATPESRDRNAFHLLIDVALRDAAARGVRRWHFGGSGGNPRIEYFKESFGARPVPVYRYHRLAGWAKRLRPRPSWDA
jgi:hypothetical protein